MTHPYDKTTYDGKTVDWLTRAALEDAAEALNYDDGLTLAQGSYNAGGVAASGGTHDGGGVVDLSAFEHVKKVAALRKLGFAAWYRPTLPGVWTEHIHAVQMGNAKLSPAAKAQVDAYIAGRNGLANNGPDNGPRQWVDVRYSWREGAGRVNRARALLKRAQALLATGVRGINVGPSQRILGKAIGRLPSTEKKG